MEIKVPRWLARGLHSLDDFVNLPLWRPCQRFELRVIDIPLALGFLGCALWYYIDYGWPGLVLGVAGYVFAAAAAMLVRDISG